MAYTKQITLTDVEDRWLQETLQPYREATQDCDGNTNEIADAIFAKLAAAPIQ